MDPAEDAEEENNGDTLEQLGPSSSLDKSFEALLKSSSDDEVADKMFSIFRISANSTDRLSAEEVTKVFNIGLPYVEPQLLFDEETDDSETITEKLRELIEFIRKKVGNGVFDIGPFVGTFTKPSGLKELKARNGLGLFATLSYRLCNTEVWMFRYDSNREYEMISDLQMKVMCPVMFAALTSKPNILHFLLKYGIRLLDEIRGYLAPANAIPMGILCKRVLLNDIITELFENSDVWDFDTMELKTDLSNLPEGLRSKCLNFRLLLRCDPNPHVTTVKLARLNDPQLPPLPEMNVLHHVYDSLFPDLGLGLFNPSQLQHMCRCVIRRHLHENWQLPDGIFQLEVSKILCDYLNLLHD